MLKSYLSDKGLSIYKLSKASLVPYSTLNDLVNHKLPVENLKSGQLYAIATALSIDMNTLYEMCLFNPVVTSQSYNVTARITVEHKTYYLNFERNGVHIKEEILPVKQESTTYLKTLALWKLDEILDDFEMEDAYETLCSKKIR